MENSDRSHQIVSKILLVSSLVFPLATGSLAQTRDAPPTAAEAEAALIQEKEYHDNFGTILSINGCVPAAWEDNEVSKTEVNWWCMAQARKSNGETYYDSIGFQRLPGDRRFAVLQGEYLGMCPSGKLVAKALKPLIKKSGVTGILDDPRGQPGQFAPSDDDTQDSFAHPVFDCEYFGNWKKLNYILHVSMVYENNQYRLVGSSFERLFGDHGQLVDEQGNPTGE